MSNGDLTSLTRCVKRWLVLYKLRPLGPRSKKLLNDHGNTRLPDVTLCLEVGSVSSAPPSSSYSVGQVRTPAPVTHLDELSSLKQDLARGCRLKLPCSWQQMLKKQAVFEWLSTKNISIHSSAVTFLPRRDVNCQPTLIWKKEEEKTETTSRVKYATRSSSHVHWCMHAEGYVLMKQTFH